MQSVARSSIGLRFVFASSLIGAFGCGIDEAGTIPGSGSSNSSTNGASGSTSSGMGGAGGVGGSDVSSSSSSSSSSGSGGSGGMGAPEVCNDGIDNDKDSSIDCADKADCGQLYSCNTLPNGGWSFVRIRQTMFGGAQEPCGAGIDPKVLYVDPDDGSCNSCSCSASGDCSIEMTCYSDNNCTMQGTSMKYTTDDDPCTLDSIAAGGGSCKLTGAPMVPSDAACKAQGSGLTNTNPYAGELHVCQAASKAAGCGMMETCVLAPSGTYEDRLCVMKAGQQACPAGFPESHVGFGDFTDNRKCSDCGCDPGAITCVGNSFVTLWYDNACMQNAAGVSSNGNCVDILSQIKARNVTSIAQMTVPMANCPQPVPSGSTNGIDVNTVCCAAP